MLWVSRRSVGSKYCQCSIFGFEFVHFRGCAVIEVREGDVRVLPRDMLYDFMIFFLLYAMPFMSLQFRILHAHALYIPTIPCYTIQHTTPRRLIHVNFHRYQCIYMFFPLAF